MLKDHMQLITMNLLKLNEMKNSTIRDMLFAEELTSRLNNCSQYTWKLTNVQRISRPRFMYSGGTSYWVRAVLISTSSEKVITFEGIVTNYYFVQATVYSTLRAKLVKVSYPCRSFDENYQPIFETVKDFLKEKLQLVDK